MVELDQYRYKISDYDKPLQQIKNSLDLDNKQKRIEELEADMEAPGFWDDTEKSQKAMKELKALKDSFEKYDALVRGLEDTKTLIEMAEEENDASLLPEIDSEITTFEEHLEELRIETLLSGEYDRSNAILTLHAGAGGTESCDWCQMLMRMYTRWAERKGYTTEVIDYLEGEEAGVKSVTIEISGPDAYGHLKSEHGVHRLVRISPFNAAGKRQTSFVSCDVMPDIDENIDIEINPDDLRIDTYRSSGAGGQHINKTSSAIRITHLPTGIVVQCQNERSQLFNKDKAMQMLKAKLYLLKKQEQERIARSRYLNEVIDDIGELEISSGEDDELEKEYALAKNSEKTLIAIKNAVQAISGEDAASDMILSAESEISPYTDNSSELHFTSGLLQRKSNFPILLPSWKAPRIRWNLTVSGWSTFPTGFRR